MLRTAIIGVAISGAAIGLAGCADGYYGGGSVGYAGGYGYGGYDRYYGDPYGYRSVPFGYAGAGFGWYGDYYYPGTGYYVYDRGGRRRQWDDRQRGYWQQRGGERRGYHADHRDNRHDDRQAYRQGQFGAVAGEGRRDARGDRDPASTGHRARRQPG